MQSKACSRLLYPAGNKCDAGSFSAAKTIIRYRWWRNVAHILLRTTALTSSLPSHGGLHKQTTSHFEERSDLHCCRGMNEIPHNEKRAVTRHGGRIVEKPRTEEKINTHHKHTTKRPSKQSISCNWSLGPGFIIS